MLCTQRAMCSSSIPIMCPCVGFQSCSVTFESCGSAGGEESDFSFCLRDDIASAASAASPPAGTPCRFSNGAAEEGKEAEGEDEPLLPAAASFSFSSSMRRLELISQTRMCPSLMVRRTVSRLPWGR